MLPCRYGIVETAPKAQVNSWMPGRKLSLQARKVLVWVHIAAVNVASIGELTKCPAYVLAACCIYFYLAWGTASVVLC